MTTNGLDLNVIDAVPDDWCGSSTMQWSLSSGSYANMLLPVRVTTRNRFVVNFVKNGLTHYTAGDIWKAQFFCCRTTR